MLPSLPRPLFGHVPIVCLDFDELQKGDLHDTMLVEMRVTPLALGRNQVLCPGASTLHYPAYLQNRAE